MKRIIKQEAKKIIKPIMSFFSSWKKLEVRGLALDGFFNEILNLLLVSIVLFGSKGKFLGFVDFKVFYEIMFLMFR
jgi:hypothetical protein